MQVVHEHPDRNDNGVVHQSPRWPHNIVRVADQAAQGTVHRKSRSPPVSYDLFDVRQYQGESLKEFLNRFGAQVVRLNIKDETMMVHAFSNGIVPGPFNESLIRNHPKTFGEIRCQAVAHIAVEGEASEKCTCVVPTRPHALGRPQPLRVHEATTEKKTPVKQ